MTLRIPVLRVGPSPVLTEDGSGLLLPRAMSPGAAGYDLMAAIDAPRVIPPGRHDRIPTGLALAIPEGFEGQVRPRSGLAFRHGVTVLNAPGTIDSDYRGEIQVLLINHGTEPFVVERGARIAQLVIARVERAEFSELSTLPTSARGDGGFGSTGNKGD